jgi:hypothetical protein
VEPGREPVFDRPISPSDLDELQRPLGHHFPMRVRDGLLGHDQQRRSSGKLTLGSTAPAAAADKQRKGDKEHSTTHIDLTRRKG